MRMCTSRISGSFLEMVDPSSWTSELSTKPVSQFLGVQYSLTSPYGFNGGFYYLRFRADFD